MVRTDLWTVLTETQKYISKYYALALTDESKHDELKSYIEKFILDNGYIESKISNGKLIYENTEKALMRQEDLC